MITKFKNNQIVKLREGFFRGSFVKLLDHRIDKDTKLNVYKGVMQSKAGNRFVDVHPKKEDWYKEHELRLLFKFFGAYL